MKRISFLFLSFLSTLALAAPDIQVWGRVYDYSCGYFSRRAADVSVTLKDDSLPFGTEVNLVIGWSGEQWIAGGKHERVNWVDRTVVPMKAIDKFTWEGKALDKTFGTRSGARWFDTAQFVFEIKAPNEAPRYVHGDSKWGYFETERMNPGTNCVTTGKPLPDWKKLTHSVIKRD